MGDNEISQSLGCDGVCSGASVPRRPRAADWGGIKEIGGDVPIPVPAPAPVPTYDVYSDWYVGFAIGANVLQDATITDTDTDYLEIVPGHCKDSGDIGASPIFGLNFGRYITPSLRAEIADRLHARCSDYAEAER